MSFLGIAEAVGKAGLSAGGSIVSGLFSQKAQAREAEKNRQFQKQMYETNVNQQSLWRNQDRQWSLDDYNRQRQDYVNDLLSADSRSSESRKNAGLSIAFSNGYSAAQPLGADIRDTSAPSTTPPSGSMANLSPLENPVNSILQQRMTDAQVRLAEANANKAEVDATKGTTENERMKLELEKAKKTFQTDIDTAKANLDNIISQTDLNKDKRDEISANINKLTAEANQIEFDVDKIKPQELANLKAEWQEIFAKIDNLNSQSSVNSLDAQLKKIQKHFNELGIGVGSGLFDSVLGLLTSGNGTKTFKELKSFVSDLFNGLVNIDFGDIGGNVAGGIKKVAKGGVDMLDKFFRGILGDDTIDEYARWLKNTKFGKTVRNLKNKSKNKSKNKGKVK